MRLMPWLPMAQSPNWNACRTTTVEKISAKTSSSLGMNGGLGMRTWQSFSAIVGITLIWLGARATVQITLPDGPNRDLVSRVCSTCHDLGMVVGAGGRSREGWDGTIEDMMSYGMSITPAERRLVLDYLATYL